MVLCATAFRLRPFTPSILALQNLVRYLELQLRKQKKYRMIENENNSTRSFHDHIPHLMAQAVRPRWPQCSAWHLETARSTSVLTCWNQRLSGEAERQKAPKGFNLWISP